MERGRGRGSFFSHHQQRRQPQPNRDPIEKLSRTLCWYLRHWVQPEKVYPGGWVDVEDMMNHPTFSSRYSLQHIQDHVDNQGEYKRIELQEDSASGKLQIRAKHFHSREVEQTDWIPLTHEDEGLIAVYPTTGASSWNNYITKGFRPKDNRTHIHFWIRNPENEKKILGPEMSASPRNVFFYIDWKKALNDGLEFFKSDDGMIMTRGNEEGVLEPKYIEKIVDIVTGEVFSAFQSWTPITKEENIPLPIVVHPTSETAWQEIVNNGFRVKKGWENLFFRVGDPDDENKVLGPSCPFDIFMYINIHKALTDGLEFFLGSNANMVKTRGNLYEILEPHYIEKVVNVKNGEIYWKSPKQITSAVDGPILVFPALKSNWEIYKDRGFSPDYNKSYIRFMIRDPDNPNRILGDAMPDANYDVFIYIDLKRAMNDGWKFFLRDDGSAMTLCGRWKVLDPKYIDKIVDLSTGKPIRYF